MACRLVELLSQWEAPHAVPALIEFLQNDDFAYQVGDDMGIPALKAKAALRELTGNDFPLDVEASRNAWRKVKAVGYRGERARQLARLLAHDPRPLAGELISDKKGSAVIVWNPSKQPVVVMKTSSGVAYEWTDGIGGGPNDHRPVKKDEFTTLAPGDSLRVDVKSEWVDRSRLTRLTVYFQCNGNDIGLKAWIGKVVLNFNPNNS